MNPALILCGKVFAGLGEGAKYVLLYREELRRLLECEPFPGTLNVALHSITLSKIVRDLVKRRSIVIPPPRHGLKPVFAFVASFFGIRCLVLIPEASIYGFSALEIVACKNLRRELSLEDGDVVCVEIRDDDPRWLGTVKRSALSERRHIYP